MKRCNDCKHAEWQKTAAGRLHPLGDGRCTYPYKVPALPGAFVWIGVQEPKPLGGYINRWEELNYHCPYWALREARG